MKHPLESNALFIAQTAQAVREDESYLADFVDVWDKLAPEFQPPALRKALWCLTTVFLSNPLQAEIRLQAVARASSLPKSELRRQIKERAAFFSIPPENRDKDYQEVLCRLILR